MSNRLRKPLTLKTIAADAGVSVATVSRVLAKVPNFKVSKKTEERIFQLARAMGYTYNASAKSLRTRKTSCLELFIPEIGNPIYTPIVAGANAAAIEDGYQILINTSTGDETPRLDTWLGEQRVDGILVNTLLMNKERVAIFDSLQYPYEVFFSSLATPRYVTFDEHEVMQLAVKHLRQLGHIRIAYLTGPLSINSFGVRFEHFVLALQEFGLVYHPELCIQGGRSSFHNGAESLNKLLTTGHAFTAVIGATVNIAVGALHAAAGVGLTIPQHVSILGINDSPVAEVTTPSLTMVRTPLYGIGYHGVKNLLLSIKGERALTPLVIRGSELQIRGTTDRVSC